jgi:protein gp37
VADKSAIEWTEATWNPTTGCDQVSPGCDNCYALNLAPRLKAMGSKRYQRDGDPRTSGPGFGLSLHSDTLALPIRWTKPRRIFVNSMSDLFHNEVPDRFIADVFAVMSLAKQHTFQLLTKRHGRMRSLLNSGEFWIAVNATRMVRGVSVLPGGGPVVLPNVWIGVSVEDQKRAELRIPALLDTPAAVRWLSCEPLLGPVDIFANSGIDRYPGLDWVVVGGESGLRSRPMEAAWARVLRDECVGADIPFFFKQWGGRTPKTNGRELDGRTWDEYPAAKP